MTLAKLRILYIPLKVFRSRSILLFNSLFICISPLMSIFNITGSIPTNNLINLCFSFLIDYPPPNKCPFCSNSRLMYNFYIAKKKHPIGCFFNYFSIFFTLFEYNSLANIISNSCCNDIILSKSFLYNVAQLCRNISNKSMSCIPLNRLILPEI